MESAKKTNIAGSKAKSRSVGKTSEEKKRYITIIYKFKVAVTSRCIFAFNIALGNLVIGRPLPPRGFQRGAVPGRELESTTVRLTTTRSTSKRFEQVEWCRGREKQVGQSRTL